MADNPRIGVGVIIRRGEQILLIRRYGVHGSGTWSTPGGHLDFGETPEACAAREAMEETGIEVGNVRFRAITNDVFDAESKHYITIWMEAEYVGGEARVNADHEMSEIAWFAPDQLPDPLFLSFENLMSGRCYPADRSQEGAPRV